MDITLEDRYWSKVQKSDGCWLWAGSRTKNGYGNFSIARKMHYAHRLSWSSVNGDIPEGVDVDHICHTRLCVNPQHLRLATRSENMQNASGAHRDSKSGVRGVSWHSHNKSYRARVYLNGKCHLLGYFPDIKDAEAAVTAWRRENMPYSAMDHISQGHIDGLHRIK